MDIYATSQTIEFALPAIKAMGYAMLGLGALNALMFYYTNKDIKELEMHPNVIEAGYKSQMPIIGKLGYPGRRLAYLKNGVI